MTAALAPFAWSLLLTAGVVVFSTVPLGAGRSQANFQMADLAAPRAMFERLPAWGKRAAWAHQNCFEALTLHAPACLLCLLAGVGSPVALVAAWIHPALRLAGLHRRLCRQPAPGAGPVLGRRPHVHGHPLRGGAQGRAGQLSGLAASRRTSR